MSKDTERKSNQVRQKGRTANVLIVDEDVEATRSILEILAAKGIRGTVVSGKKSALEFIEKDDYDIVFICDGICQRDVTSTCEFSNDKKDVRENTSLTAQQGYYFELLRMIRSNSPELPVIMVGSGQIQKETLESLWPVEPQRIRNQQQVVRLDSVNEEIRTVIEKAVNAIRAGCCDFLVKPLKRERIESLLNTLLPNHSISTVASAKDGARRLYEIVGRSPKLLQVIDLAKKIASTSSAVLISGESGTGKELISYLVHHNSKRSQGPYVKVNCAALSDSLLESELFGHEKGAFTGAFAQRKGRFEMAHGGTLLLDEITETPLRFQAKLLRVLEQQDFERVGGNENIRINVRVISTTNKDLLHEVAQGRFRRDLYYRLSGVRLIIPPLRERLEDLRDLIWHFVNLYQREVQRNITRLDPIMIDIFSKYHWPGNIRQLRNVVLTSLILGVGQTLSLADVSWLFDELQPLPEVVDNEHQTVERKTGNNSGLGGVPLKQLEQQAILDTLRQTAGNQTRAAKALGISDRTLREKVRQYRQQGCLQLM